MCPARSTARETGASFSMDSLFNYILDIVTHVPTLGYATLPNATVIQPAMAQAGIRLDVLCDHHLICYCAMIDYKDTMAAPTTAQDASCKSCILLPPSAMTESAKALATIINEFANLIAAAGRLCFGLDGRSYRSRFDNPRKSFLDGVVDTQSSECDAARLAIVERTPLTGIARNVLLGACVADRQLASTPPAADKAGGQRVAVLRRSVMSACGQVVAHHLADRLRPVCTENFIRVDDVMESPKLAE
jgi:hypothetical protein